MTNKQRAAEIYAMPYHLRKAALAEIPESDRHIVRTYIEQLAKQAQDANRRRNMEKMGPIKRLT